MTNRPLTAQIKQSTREAVLDQLAAIADGIIEQRMDFDCLEGVADSLLKRNVYLKQNMKAGIEAGADKIIDLMAQVVVAEAERDAARLLRPWHLAWWRA